MSGGNATPERLGAFSDGVPAIYAGIFLLLTISFMVFQGVIASQFQGDASPAAWLQPALSLAIIVAVSGLYFVPEALWCRLAALKLINSSAWPNPLSSKCQTRCSPRRAS
jgi:hypothetical protein